MVDRLELQWQQELARASAGGSGAEPSLWRALYRLLRREFWLSALWCLGESTTRILQPVFLGYLLGWMVAPHAERELSAGVLWTCGLTATAMCQIWIHHAL